MIGTRWLCQSLLLLYRRRRLRANLPEGLQLCPLELETVPERTRMREAPTGEAGHRFCDAEQRLSLLCRPEKAAGDLGPGGSGGHRAPVPQVAGPPAAALACEGSGGRLRLAVVDLADGGEPDPDLRSPAEGARIL